MALEKEVSNLSDIILDISCKLSPLINPLLSSLFIVSANFLLCSHILSEKLSPLQLVFKVSLTVYFDKISFNSRAGLEDLLEKAEEERRQVSGDSENF